MEAERLQLLIQSGDSGVSDVCAEMKPVLQPTNSKRLDSFSKTHRLLHCESWSVLWCFLELYPNLLWMKKTKIWHNCRQLYIMTGMFLVSLTVFHWKANKCSHFSFCLVCREFKERRLSSEWLSSPRRRAALIKTIWTWSPAARGSVRASERGKEGGRDRWQERAS